LSFAVALRPPHPSKDTPAQALDKGVHLSSPDRGRGTEAAARAAYELLFESSNVLAT
jgi:hypothetical protein